MNMQCLLLFAVLIEVVVGQQARVLLYTATAAFRHDSIPTAIESLQNGAPSHNILLDATEDRGVFTEESLSSYDAVMFVSTTGEGGLIRSSKVPNTYILVHSSG